MVREQNEDAFFVDDDLGLYVVADGMGGHAAGEVASATAIATVTKHMRKHRDLLKELKQGRGEHDRMLTIVRKAVEEACGKVYELATSTDGQAGMGCTLTMLMVAGTKALMGHVGDTRLYLKRDSKVSQLTSDHTMANELAIAGLIEPSEIKTHHYAHVLTRAVGTQPSVKVDTLVMDLVPGDRFMLCSDGLTEYIEDNEWLAPQLANKDLEAISEELVSYANTSGGHDNVTCVVVQMNADDPEIEILDEMSVEIQGRFDALEAVFLFDGLSMLLLTRVLSHCDVKSYEPGQVAITEGDPCGQLMIVLDGAFCVSHRGQEDGELEPGEHAGVTTLLAPRKARATLTATKSARLLILQHKPFWALIKARPWLGVGLLERVGRRLSLDLDRSIAQRDDGDPATTPVKPRERL